MTEFWDRYRIGGKGFSLTIYQLECDDRGTYVCKAINGFGVHEISFQLNLSSKFHSLLHCSSTQMNDSLLMYQF